MHVLNAMGYDILRQQTLIEHLITPATLRRKKQNPIPFVFFLVNFSFINRSLSLSIYLANMLIYLPLKV